MRRLLAGLAVYTVLTLPTVADETMACVQQALTDLGYAAGPVDGAIGGRTRAASAALSSEAGLALPDLAEDNAAEWCSALTAFSATAQAGLLQSPARSVLPGDIIMLMPQIVAGPGPDYCGASNPAASGALNIEPIDRISGFTSRMSNIVEVENARALENFSGAFGGQAVAAYASGDVEAQAELIRIFARWAEADALLGTESCVRGNGELVNSGSCTEWTRDDGSDLSGMKDATFVTFIGAGLVRAYYATLSDVMPDELAAEHAAIAEWIGKWSERLKRPEDVYFGLNMGWYWPTVANEIAAGDLDSARSKLTRIADAMIRLIRDDGSIAERTTRGNRALWYHFTSLGEVVMSMELMRASGMTPPPALEEKLHKAVRLFIEATKDHAYIDKWARVANNSIYDGTQDWDAGWMQGNFAGTWLQVYPYRYAGLDTAEELRQLVGPKARSGRADIDLGLPLGCVYEAASALRGNAFVPAEPPAKLTLVRAAAFTVFQNSTFTEYQVVAGGAAVDDVAVGPVSFSVYADYHAETKQPQDLALLRMVFPRSALHDPASKEADYTGCSELSAEVTGSEQKLRLHFGEESPLNACVLNLMAEPDRKLWTALHANFRTILETAGNDKAKELLERLDWVE